MPAGEETQAACVEGGGMMDEMNDDNEEHEYLFSFGFGHKHPKTGEPLRGCYVRIRGTLDSSREKMFKAFGSDWCFQYLSPSEAGVEVYGMREIPYPEAS
jgi:hypothetical protein